MIQTYKKRSKKTEPWDGFRNIQHKGERMHNQVNEYIEDDSMNNGECVSCGEEFDGATANLFIRI